MPRDKLNIIGSNVKRLRLSMSPVMTQEYLAVKLQLQDWDITRFGISKIERGERRVTDIEIFKLARALEVPIISLFEE